MIEFTHRSVNNGRFIRRSLLNLFPDKKLKLSDFVTTVRQEMFHDIPLDKGRKQAYRRICLDFKEGVCWRNWGSKEGYRLVKLDGSDKWVYLGWIREEELTKPVRPFLTIPWMG